MLLAQNSQSELANEIQIARRKVLSRTASIFPKGHIQLPMQAVLNSPMLPYIVGYLRCSGLGEVLV